MKKTEGYRLPRLDETLEPFLLKKNPLNFCVQCFLLTCCGLLTRKFKSQTDWFATLLTFPFNLIQWYFFFLYFSPVELCCAAFLNTTFFVPTIITNSQPWLGLLKDTFRFFIYKATILDRSLIYNSCCLSLAWDELVIRGHCSWESVEPVCESVDIWGRQDSGCLNSFVQLPNTLLWSRAGVQLLFKALSVFRKSWLVTVGQLIEKKLRCIQDVHVKYFSKSSKKNHVYSCTLAHSTQI